MTKDTVDRVIMSGIVASYLVSPKNRVAKIAKLIVTIAVTSAMLGIISDEVRYFFYFEAIAGIIGALLCEIVSTRTAHDLWDIEVSHDKEAHEMFCEIIETCVKISAYRIFQVSMLAFLTVSALAFSINTEINLRLTTTALSVIALVLVVIKAHTDTKHGYKREE